MLRIKFILFSYILLPILVLGQKFPVNLTFQDETHMLLSAGTNTSNFYNEDELKSVYLDFAQEDFWQQLHNFHDTDDYLMGTLTYEGHVYDSIGARFKGQTSYQKIKDEEKLSFAVSINEYVKGQDIEGYNNFNFNNAYQDPTFMREVLYNHLNRENIPAARANFVKLYINGEYWGIYDNVQQLNKDFTKEWFLTNNGSLWRADAPKEGITKSVQERPPGPGGGPNWGDGTAALNFLGNDTSKYQEYYTLKSSEQNNPWELLVKLTDILNNVPRQSLVDSLSSYLNIDRTLWYLAHETVFSDDDSYVHKGKMDYYAYYEPETNQFVPLEFDGNSALGARNATWSVFYNEENENYPLMNRLYAIPELRQRYLAHVRTIIDELLDPEYYESVINNYDALIRDAVESDPKKLTTFFQYNSGLNTLRNFFVRRKQYLETESEILSSGLEISSVFHKAGEAEFASPNEGEQVSVSADISGIKNVGRINLYYCSGIVGNFTKIEMFDDGEHEDGMASDGIYGGIIPGFPGGSYIRYYIEAIAADAAKTVTYSPAGAEHDVYFYRVNVAEIVSSDLVINEFVAANSSVIADNAGEFDDWIELYNNSDQPLSLAGYYMSDNSGNLRKWELPDMTLDAKSFFIIWADDDEEQGNNHANFKLSADGEEIFLVTANGEIADQLTFGGQEQDVSYGRYPNGTGEFRTLIPSFNAENKLNITSVNSEVVSDNVQDLKIYPNPFNYYSFIEFSLENESHVQMKVYNALGQEIKILADEYLQAKKHRIRWDGTDQNGIKINNGFYICRLIINGKNGISNISHQIIKIE